MKSPPRLRIVLKVLKRKQEVYTLVRMFGTLLTAIHTTDDCDADSNIFDMNISNGRDMANYKIRGTVPKE